MKNITIVLQRSELNYLINYDSTRISPERIINFSYNDFKNLGEEQKISLLQKSLPIFEQDHEVILMEYDPMLVSYDNAPVIEFNGILSIIPLTEMGARLLSSKLNTNFNILGPLDSKLFRSFQDNRNHLLRIRASRKLCSIYDLSFPNEEFINDFKTATLFQLNNIEVSENDSTLAHLIDFNVTPSFIPEGNIEAIIKSACVGLKKLNKEVDQITRSTFYSFVNNEKTAINSKTLFEAINFIKDKIEFSEDAKSKFDDLTRTLSENGKYDNAFLLFSFFYYLKKEIEKNNYDISAPKKDILELKQNDSDAASKVLFMLGYTFSIQTISKSIQSFSKSALLKTHKNLDLEWNPKVMDHQVFGEPKTEKTNTECDETIKDDNLIPNQSSNKIEKEETMDIKLSVEKDKYDEKTIVESKENNKAESASLPLELFTEPKDNEIDIAKEQEANYGFTFQDFKKNIGGKTFLNKIVATIKSKETKENLITQDLVISCLKEIDEYETKSGKLKKNAERALKIFE
ncbi:hypothetical protein DET49_1125 [Salegentibacter sp. 24]|uniref:hypothetical protein n=1 Tax=Salegentibacter sp. 24 TaxID=2183986 RepID=UPI00105D87EA|nr:hypothetical protein [Salegentibacter sp. 24]TDN87316.1 hypothetical protein DET49_1125 [Salegentibacter sp. 24]